MLNLFIMLLWVLLTPTPIAHAQIQTPLPEPPLHVVATSTVDIVREIQHKYSLGEDFYQTAKCESKFNKNAVGDYGTSYGVWQIHLPAHPSITKAQALDPRFASEWAAQQFLAHKQRMWSCWKLLYV